MELNFIVFPFENANNWAPYYTKRSLRPQTIQTYKSLLPFGMDGPNLDVGRYNF